MNRGYRDVQAVSACPHAKHEKNILRITSSQLILPSQQSGCGRVHVDWCARGFADCRRGYTVAGDAL